MTPCALLDQFRDIVSALVAKKATGKHILVVDMNQGGIGSFCMFGACRNNKDETIFISNKGAEVLRKVVL